MTPLSPELSAGFAIVSVPPNAARRWSDGLHSQYGVATSSGTRLCAHIYTTRHDVEAAIEG